MNTDTAVTGILLITALLGLTTWGVTYLTGKQLKEREKKVDDDDT